MSTNQIKLIHTLLTLPTSEVKINELLRATPHARDSKTINYEKCEYLEMTEFML